MFLPPEEARVSNGLTWNHIEIGNFKSYGSNLKLYKPKPCTDPPTFHEQPSKPGKTNQRFSPQLSPVNDRSFVCWSLIGGVVDQCPFEHNMHNMHACDKLKHAKCNWIGQLIIWPPPWRSIGLLTTSLWVCHRYCPWSTSVVACNLLFLVAAVSIKPKSTTTSSNNKSKQWMVAMTKDFNWIWKTQWYVVYKVPSHPALSSPPTPHHSAVCGHRVWVPQPTERERERERGFASCAHAFRITIVNKFMSTPSVSHSVRPNYDSVL